MSTRRKVGMPSGAHGLYDQGYTSTKMAGTKGSNTARGIESQKAGLSPYWSMQLDSMKLESLVSVDQNATVNTFPGLVHTARHTTKVGCTRRRWANPQGRQAPKVWLVIGVKS